MIDKSKIQNILEKKEEDEPFTPIENIRHIHHELIPLVVVLCGEESSIQYQKMKNSSLNILICSNIQYLNSINHLDNVGTIIVDCSSFTDLKEICFLIKVFRLLHQNSSIVLCTENNQSIFEIQKILKDSIKNLYIIDKDMIDCDFEKNMTPMKNISAKKERKRFWSNKKIFKTLSICISAIIILMVGALLFTHFSNQDDSETIHNRNMNVQIDFGGNTVLPIKEVYSDEQGNHIVIEMKSTSEETKISLFDNEQNKIATDTQKTECPDKQCDQHYELTFSKNKEVTHYILQLENKEQIKNVEIDQIYFK